MVRNVAMTTAGLEETGGTGSGMARPTCEDVDGVMGKGAGRRKKCRWGFVSSHTQGLKHTFVIKGSINKT